MCVYCTYKCKTAKDMFYEIRFLNNWLRNDCTCIDVNEDNNYVYVTEHFMYYDTYCLECFFVDDNYTIFYNGQRTVLTISKELYNFLMDDLKVFNSLADFSMLPLIEKQLRTGGEISTIDKGSSCNYYIYKININKLFNVSFDEINLIYCCKI